MAHSVVKALLDLPAQETLGVKTLVDRLEGDIQVKPIMLTAGEPDEEHTKPFLQQLAVGGKKKKYGDANGLPELKEAIARYISSYTGIDYKPEDIFIGGGGRLVNFALMQAAPSLVTALEPFWPGYSEALLVVEALGGSKVSDVYEFIERDADFRITQQSLDDQLALAEKKLGRMGLNQIMHLECEPGNPLPLVSSKDEIYQRAKVLAGHPQVKPHFDDVYREIVFDPEETEVHSLAKAYVESNGNPEDLTILFSASKIEAVPGYRVAAIATKDKDLIKSIEAISRRIGYNASTPAQHAVAIALQNGTYQQIARNIAKKSEINFGILNGQLGNLSIGGERAFDIFPTKAGIYAVVQGRKQAFEGAQYEVNGTPHQINNTENMHDWMIRNGFVPVNASGMSPLGKRDNLFRICIAGSTPEIIQAVGYLNNPTYPIIGKG